MCASRRSFAAAASDVARTRDFNPGPERLLAHGRRLRREGRVDSGFKVGRCGVPGPAPENRILRPNSSKSAGSRLENHHGARFVPANRCAKHRTHNMTTAALSCVFSERPFQRTFPNLSRRFPISGDGLGRVSHGHDIQTPVRSPRLTGHQNQLARSGRAGTNSCTAWRGLQRRASNESPCRTSSTPSPALTARDVYTADNSKGNPTVNA